MIKTVLSIARICIYVNTFRMFFSKININFGDFERFFGDFTEVKALIVKSRNCGIKSWDF